MNGFVYVIQSSDHTVKIGSSSSPKSRLSSMASGTAAELKLIASIECDDRKHAFAVEKDVRRQLKPVHMRGEWFKINAHQAAHIVKLVRTGKDLECIAEIVEVDRLYSLPDHEGTKRAHEIKQKLQREGKWAKSPMAIMWEEKTGTSLY